jgi:hypothetical protein
LKKYGLIEDDSVAVYAGAQGRAYGVESVLDVAANLKNKGFDNINFLFVGDGKLEGNLQKRTRKDELNNCVSVDPVSKI